MSRGADRSAPADQPPAHEGRDSISGQSSRNITGPTATPSTTSPNSPAAAPQKKKKGGLLSIFGCCGVPDSANTLDANEEPLPSHKLDRIPQRPTTSRSRRTVTPSEQPNSSKSQLFEKEKEKEIQPVQDHSASTKHASASTSQEQSVAESESKQPTLVGTTGPSITINAPPSESQREDATTHAVTKDDDSDVNMTDAQPAVAEQTQPRSDEQTAKSIPPPPAPIPAADASSAKHDEQEIATANGETQKWLLPPLEPKFKGKKCLVLDLDETLVHASFKILHQADFTLPIEIEGNYHNVYVIKRPGVDQFMKRVGELYEVVVFTASVSKYGDPLLDLLDIHKVVSHRLFRESCYNHQGNYVKDLSQVGRDLKDTIIIDNSPTSYIFHPQHAIPISSWFSDAHDNELLDLIPVLEDLASSNVQDVSLVLDVTL